MRYVPDTHAIVWYLLDSGKLSQRAKATFDDPSIDIIIPAIVLAEIRFLELRGRIQVDLEGVLSFIKDDARCSIAPLDEAIARLIPPELNIHDGLICATALAHRVDPARDDVRVITRDRAITESGLVQTVWQ